MNSLSKAYNIGARQACEDFEKLGLSPAALRVLLGSGAGAAVGGVGGALATDPRMSDYVPGRGNRRLRNAFLGAGAGAGLGALGGVGMNAAKTMRAAPVPRVGPAQMATEAPAGVGRAPIRWPWQKAPNQPQAKMRPTETMGPAPAPRPVVPDRPLTRHPWPEEVSMDVGHPVARAVPEGAGPSGWKTTKVTPGGRPMTHDELVEAGVLYRPPKSASFMGHLARVKVLS